MKKYFLIIMVLLAGAASGGPLRVWESFTSFDQTREMVIHKGRIWVATSGGLISIDPQSREFVSYTNTDGLGMSNLYCLYVDDKDRLWVGGYGRLVDFTDPAHPEQYIFTDADGRLVNIYDIAGVPGGDSIWLANYLGLTIFLPGEAAGEGLILDTYTRLGGIDRETPVRAVTIDAQNVWAGTDRGLAVGSRQNIRLLKAPTGWESFTPADYGGPVDNVVTSLAYYDEEILVGSHHGIFRFDKTDTTFESFGLYGDPLIYNLTLSGGNLFIHSSRGSYSYFGGILSSLPTAGMPIPNSTCGLFAPGGQYWNGNLLGGIFYHEGAGLARLDVGGMISNDCRRVVKTQGKLWAAMWSSGLARYDGATWTRIDAVAGNVYSLGVGPLGELWIGTWGGGVYRILGDSIAHFNADNSDLSGVSENPAFVVVADIHGSADAVWFANLRGVNGELVAVDPYDLARWKSYIITGGPLAEWVEAVTAGKDVAYLGSMNNGIFARLYNGTPLYGGDDATWRFTADSSALGSNMINCLAIDRFDTLWAGTAFGLSYQGLGEVYFNSINMPDSFGPSVTALAFDGQGNLYAGSARGLAIRDLSTGDFEYLTTRNSGLVDDNIKDIYYDPEGICLWIATAGGLSRMTAPYALATNSLDQVLAYPNPFVIRSGEERVRFNYAGMAVVHIYTVAGELVRQLPFNGEWDGRNEDGRPAASGLYVFTLTDDAGEVGRGKIFLVRE